MPGKCDIKVVRHCTSYRPYERRIICEFANSTRVTQKENRKQGSNNVHDLQVLLRAAKSLAPRRRQRGNAIAHKAPLRGARERERERAREGASSDADDLIAPAYFSCVLS